jgi:hypothetical protein
MTSKPFQSTERAAPTRNPTVQRARRASPRTAPLDRLRTPRQARTDGVRLGLQRGDRAAATQLAPDLSSPSTVEA